MYGSHTHRKGKEYLSGSCQPHVRVVQGVEIGRPQVIETQGAVMDGTVVAGLQGNGAYGQEDTEQDQQRHTYFGYLFYTVQAFRQDIGIQQQAEQVKNNGFVRNTGGGGPDVHITVEKGSYGIAVHAIERTHNGVHYVRHGPGFDITIVGGYGYIGKDTEYTDVFPEGFFAHFVQDKRCGVVTVTAAVTAHAPFDPEQGNSH